MLKEIREFGYRVLKMASGVFSIATLPLFTAESGRARVGFLGTIKNRFLKAIGKGAPFQEESDKIRSSQSERRRGNVFNPSFAHDGRLSLRLMDGLIDEDALKVLDVLGNAGATKASDPTKALESLDPASRSAMSRRSKAEYKKLYELKSYLESNGGSLSIERSHDGFSRVLVIKIGITDKTERDVRNELENVFKAISVSDPELVKSISEQLLKRGSADLNSMSVTDSQKSQGLSSEGEDMVTHGDERKQTSGKESVHSVEAKDPTRLELDSSVKDYGMERGATGDQGLSDESFSMSGAAIPPTFSGADPVTMQFQFLREGASLSDAKLTKEAEEAKVEQMTDISLADVAAGLDVVESCDVVDAPVPPGQPSVSPTTQSQRPGASR